MQSLPQPPRHNEICCFLQDNYCLKSFLCGKCNMIQRESYFTEFYQLMRFQSTEVQFENPNAILGHSYRGLWFVKSYNEIFLPPDVQMLSWYGINNAWHASHRPKLIHSDRMSEFEFKCDALLGLTE